MDKKSGQRILNSHLTEEETKMANKFVKRCSTSLVVREMQIK